MTSDSNVLAPRQPCVTAPLLTGHPTGNCDSPAAQCIISHLFSWALCVQHRVWYTHTSLCFYSFSSSSSSSSFHPPSYLIFSPVATQPLLLFCLAVVPSALAPIFSINSSTGKLTVNATGPHLLVGRADGYITVSTTIRLYNNNNTTITTTTNNNNNNLSST